MYTQVQILSLGKKKTKQETKPQRHIFLKHSLKFSYFIWKSHESGILNWLDPGTVTHTCNPSTWEVKEKELLQVRGQLKLQTKHDQ